MTDVNRPRLGEPNAPCRTCAAPLAEDQRYCLQCGTRRAEARLAFLDILERKGASGLPPAVTPARRGTLAGLAGISTNAAAVAGVACLLLALGVGVLIGNHRTSDTATAAPPAITVAAPAPASAVAPAPTTTATTTTAAAGSDASTTATRKSKGSSTSSSSASKATNSEVGKLQGATGADYVKKSSKLPKTVGTGGKAPPKDDKPAAGGGSFESIG